MAKKFTGLHESEIVEVVIKKNMSFKDYLEMIPSIKRKGYMIQAYKIGVFQKKLSKEIE